jgi:hypothetical protein
MGKGIEQTEEVQLPNKCMKKCSTTLAIRKSKQLWDSLTPIRNAIVRKQIIKNAGKDAWGRRNPYTLLVVM